ncbi:polyphosphate kinase [Loktanella sp. 3ANDIMAR09]|uniref:VOC family protein n=1 Tax=Loktanella sp. 3ANDIMAR09 TaxID=1225657 RepID=UPI0006F6ECF4|nr:VOC family protein [Loktanella sp. 3ANDIMAR09]KQI67836.1 polyphosphate kinase [Loktanella sp. 3ANDIMAR09]
MLTLDHIAIACTDLDAGTAWVEKTLGVPLQPGGKHAAFGTHNTLLALGDTYLEVISLDPGAQRTRPAWFALDAFAGPPRCANWICRTDDLNAAVADAPADVGAIVPLERDALRWDITVPDDGSLPLQGACPTLICWGDGVPHPTETLTDRGCTLIGWEVHHPQAEALGRDLALDDPRVIYANGAPRFRATIRTPDGVRTLG